MKKLCYFISFTCFFFACKNEPKEVLGFESVELQSDACKACPIVSINVPNAIGTDSLATHINSAITKTVVNELIFDDADEATTLEDGILSFKNGFLELKEMYPDETLGWEADINGTVSYQDNNILTIKINSYIFTGGAHGQSATRFLNFDKKKGVQLEPQELFRVDSGILDFVESKFRLQEKIPEGTSINSTGFMFENETFYLPETMGYTDEGITLIYEQYEIASYADGPITLLLSFEEIAPYLNPN